MVATRWPIEQVSAPVRKLNDDSQQHCSAHSIGAASAVGKHDDNKVFSEISEILLSFVCWMCQRENKPGYMSKCEHNSQQVCFNVFHPTQAAQRQEARLLFGCCWKPWKQKRWRDRNNLPTALFPAPQPSPTGLWPFHPGGETPDFTELWLLWNNSRQANLGRSCFPNFQLSLH